MAFLLRGFVSCTCGQPYRSSLSRGRSGKHYPYYGCHNKKCEHYGKSIRRDEIEGEFETIVRRLEPAPGLLNAAHKMFKSHWNHIRDQVEEHRDALRQQSVQLGKSIDKLLERIVDTESDTVISALERRIQKLERERALNDAKLDKLAQPTRGYDETHRTAVEFLVNPFKFWRLGQYEDKRALLRLAFSERLVYERGKGYRTPKTTFPFKVLGDFFGEKTKMVGPAGLEPATYRL